MHKKNKQWKKNEFFPISFEAEHTFVNILLTIWHQFLKYRFFFLFKTLQFEFRLSGFCFGRKQFQSVCLPEQDFPKIFSTPPSVIYLFVKQLSMISVDSFILQTLRLLSAYYSLKISTRNRQVPYPSKTSTRQHTT